MYVVNGARGALIGTRTLIDRLQTHILRLIFDIL